MHVIYTGSKWDLHVDQHAASSVAPAHHQTLPPPHPTSPLPTLPLHRRRLTGFVLLIKEEQIFLRLLAGLFVTLCSFILLLSVKVAAVDTNPRTASPVSLRRRITLFAFRM